VKKGQGAREQAYASLRETLRGEQTGEQETVDLLLEMLLVALLVVSLARDLVNLVDLDERLLDDLDGLAEVVLRNDERRGEADDVDLRAGRKDGRARKGFRRGTKGASKAVEGILTCVGLARRPLLFIRRQNCQAERPFVLLPSSKTTALSSPRPRTSLTSGEPIALISSRKILPSRSARLARSSSTRTSSAAMATAQPSGLPP
jgi:hypothetical protein